jgi:glutaredoxin
MQSISVTIIGKPGCHLCDEASLVATSVLVGFSNVVLEHRDIEDNPEWPARYSEKVPVIQIDGADYGYWRIREENFRQALVGAGALLVETDSE